MERKDACLNRRTFCAGTLLLGTAGLAQAKKLSFDVITHFPAGESPRDYPLNTDNHDGEPVRLILFTATRGWRISFWGGHHTVDSYTLEDTNYSHPILLKPSADADLLAPDAASWFTKCYGTNTYGGSHGAGAIYWWTTDRRHFVHKLYTFDADGSAGLHPMGGVIQGHDGAMYGTARNGGLHGAGTAYRVTKEGELKVVHHFNPKAGEGGYPTQPPTLGSDGRYYGVTRRGGANDQGAIYGTPIDGPMTTLYSLNDISGRLPAGPLTQSGHTMYGLASYGGDHGGGTIFSFSRREGFRRLHSFHPDEGIRPMGSLCALPDGTLYGTCSEGGAGGNGTVFKFKPDTRKLVVRHHFAQDGSEGAKPLAGFCLGSNGYLYSTANQGGKFQGGTMFRVAP